MIGTRPSPEEVPRGSLSALIRRVREANPDIMDSLDVAATLESMGISDRQAQAMGEPTVFDLAEAVHRAILTSTQMQIRPLVHGVPARVLAVRLVGQFARGLTFALPMAVSILAMISLHISLASYQYFSLEQATALALATFLSFLVTGGFTQVMAYAYYLLVGVQSPNLVESTLSLLMGWGMGLSLAASLALLVLDGLFPLLPFGTMLFVVAYLVPLTALWLSFATLYVLRREYFLALITAGAAGLAFLLWRHGWSVVAAQIASILAASAVATGLSLTLFRRAHRRRPVVGSMVRSRFSLIAYNAAPYFAYGVLYFAFVFTDRLVAWTTNTTALPYAIWFRGPYELGMDWALLALILPLGAAEPLITWLMVWLQASQQTISAAQKGRLFSGLRRRYLQAMGLFALMGGGGLLLLHLAIQVAGRSSLIATALPVHGPEPFVFGWAQVAYVGLSLGLFNALLLFSLASPVEALRSLALAVLVDFVVGVAATRLAGTYPVAVVGLAAGVTYLVAVTTHHVWRLSGRIDHTLFRLT